MKKFEKEIKEKMKEIDKKSWDTEGWHGDADDLLCEVLDKLGYKFLTEWFNSHDKWYA